MPAVPTPTTAAAGLTGQRVTLSARQAAASSDADPLAAELVRVSLFPECSVVRRAAEPGGATPGWNDVTEQAHRRRRCC